MTVPFRLLIVVCLPLSLALAGQNPTEHTFDLAPPGEAPPGFTFASMRQPDPGRWTVQKRDAEIFLCHERDTSTGYSLAIAPGLAPVDLVATVRLRLTDGARTGGLVWHYLDDRHYYALTLDLAQSEVSLYRINEGHKITLASEDGLELDADAWHILKVVHTSGTIRVLVSGVQVFENDDRRNQWPGQPSRVGLLATGNSTVEFDDLRFAPRTERR